MMDSAKGIRNSTSEISCALEDKIAGRLQSGEYKPSQWLKQRRYLLVKDEDRKYTMGTVKAVHHRVVYNSQDDKTKCPTNNEK